MSWFEVVGQVSAVLAIWAIIYGIDAWRREHVGRRRLELAEDTLALFYEAEEAIKHIRHPASFLYETESVVRESHESDAQYNARRLASVVFYRHAQYQELFSKIHASRYRFMAQIGKKESEVFEELRGVVNEVVGAARVLSAFWSRNNFRTQEQEDQHRELIDKYESIFWSDLENDLIKPKVEKIIKNIEIVCLSVIAGKGSLHWLLNFRIGRKK